MEDQNTRVNKKYQVVIERDANAKDGYDFYRMDEMQTHDEDYERCIVTYYYKKIPGVHNPIMVIESIEGDEFNSRFTVIRDFEKRHALRYSVETDGLYEGLHER